GDFPDRGAPTGCPRCRSRSSPTSAGAASPPRAPALPRWRRRRIPRGGRGRPELPRLARNPGPTDGPRDWRTATSPPRALPPVRPSACPPSSPLHPLHHLVLQLVDVGQRHGLDRRICVASRHTRGLDVLERLE